MVPSHVSLKRSLPLLFLNFCSPSVWLRMMNSLNLFILILHPAHRPHPESSMDNTPPYVQHHE